MPCCFLLVALVATLASLPIINTKSLLEALQLISSWKLCMHPIECKVEFKEDCQCQMMWKRPHQFDLAWHVSYSWSWWPAVSCSWSWWPDDRLPALLMVAKTRECIMESQSAVTLSSSAGCVVIESWSSRLAFKTSHGQFHSHGQLLLMAVGDGQFEQKHQSRVPIIHLFRSSWSSKTPLWLITSSNKVKLLQIVLQSTQKWAITCSKLIKQAIKGVSDFKR